MSNARIIDDKLTKSYPDFICRRYLDFICRIAGIRPHRISAWRPTATDFELRAQHCQHIINATRDVLISLVKDAIENDPSGNISNADALRSIDAHLTDMAGEVTGALQRAADQVREVA